MISDKYLLIYAMRGVGLFDWGSLNYVCVANILYNN